MVGFRQDQDEFFSSKARGEIAAPCFFSQRLCNLDESGVAAMVPVGVIDGFKVIDVKDENGNRVTVALGSFELFANFLFKSSPIKKSCQRIDVSLVFKML